MTNSQTLGTIEATNPVLAAKIATPAPSARDLSTTLPAF